MDEVRNIILQKRSKLQDDITEIMSFIDKENINDKDIMKEFKKIKIINKLLHATEQESSKLRRASTIQVFIDEHIYENIGNDLFVLMDQIERHTNKDMIKVMIHLIRESSSIISEKERNQLIERLNKCIIKRNELLKSPQFGPVIHLCRTSSSQTPDSDKIVLLCSAIQCLNCYKITNFTGKSEMDFIAPAFCPYCKNTNIQIVPFNRDVYNENIKKYGIKNKQQKKKKHMKHYCEVM